MKPNFDYLTGIFSQRRFKFYFVLALFACSLSSCFKRYYQTNTTQTVDARTLEQLQAQKKLFIIHTPVSAFALKNVKVDSSTLSGIKDSLGAQYDPYLNPLSDKADPMARKDREMALYEVHIYTKTVFESNDPVNLNISQIDRMDVYGKDIDANRKSNMESIIGITVASVALGLFAAYAVNSAFEY